MNRLIFSFGLMIVTLFIVGPALQATEVAPDEVMVRYPSGYTHLLVADLGALLSNPALANGLIDPLQRANQPLGEIAQVVQLLQIDPHSLSVVAMGEGPGLTPFAYLEGPSAQTVLPALQGLQGAVGAPGSPYTNWNQEMIGGLPVIFTGGVFGPVQIQWAYIVGPKVLWVGTEVSFSGKPDVHRLRASTEKIIARQLGQVGPMAELLIARDLRGGTIAFVRTTDPTRDQPVLSGEAAMGFSAQISGSSVSVKFELRFDTDAQAQAALSQLQAGQSSYLSAQLYQAQFVGLLYGGRSPAFEVQTDLKGLAGLLLLTMPF
jgi:hypothetical protein